MSECAGARYPAAKAAAAAAGMAFNDWQQFWTTILACVY